MEVKGVKNWKNPLKNRQKTLKNPEKLPQKSAKKLSKNQNENSHLARRLENTELYDFTMGTKWELNGD